VQCRGYSEGLQRALTDFGADEGVAGAAVKLKEHYRIELPNGAVRVVTEKHGAAMLGQENPKGDWPEHPGVAVLITEMDGSMLPVVEVAEAVAGEAPVDRRKTRKVGWKEARLALAHEPGSVTPIFGATMGSVSKPEGGWRSAPWRREREAGPGSMGSGMGRSGLPSRGRRSLAAKCSIWSTSIIYAATCRRPER
jgi:hypothetical protein